MIRTLVLEAEVRFHEQAFVKPLQLSSGLITVITEARVEVKLLVNGAPATGRGSIYLSDLWAWPDPSLTHEAKDKVLRSYCETIAARLADLVGGEALHPLELGLRLHHSIEKTDFGVGEFAGLPLLAKAMAASPFDAALHDGTGLALKCSAFSLYGENAETQEVPSGDSFFSGKGACRAIHQHLQKPVTKLQAWRIVGARDILEKDLKKVIDKGYTAFKLKILGKDAAVDAARTAEVFRFARENGISQPRLSVDSNEANPDPESVVDYLERLRANDADAFAALEYLEQPTGRDIEKHAFEWKKVTSLKPVLLDEGLTRLDLFDLSLRQGWSGFALKTCKGHSFALLAGAWALEQNKIISLQDLTNPGLSAIHAALFAAHLPTVNGVELNSPQYTPAANAAWIPRLSGLFEPKNGFHELDFLSKGAPHGLGSEL